MNKEQLNKLRQKKMTLVKGENPSTNDGAEDVAPNEILKTLPCLLPDDVIEKLKSGCPAIVVIDDGSQTNCQSQHISKLAAIGIFSFFKDKFTADQIQQG